MKIKKIRTMRKDVEFPLPLQGLPQEGSSCLLRSLEQKKAEQLTGTMAENYGKKLGMTRREFLRSGGGMAVCFMAMNSVFGHFFSVDRAEAFDPGFAEARRKSLSDQLIFDVQTHFVSPHYSSRSLLGLRELAKQWNPKLRGEKQTLDKIHFDNYYREIFEQSDTKAALLTSAPNDDPDLWFLHNDEIAATRERVNARAGGKIMFSHAVFTPGHPGWMDELDRAIDQYKPDAWKGYTVGAPASSSKYPWRLDDEKLVYPAYEKMLKAGIRNVCIHKGLLPSSYRKRMPDTWKYGGVSDVGKAAKDWPGINFIIYHSGLEHGAPPTAREVGAFEKSGSIPWISDLAAVPEAYGVTNVYGEIGSTFAISAISQPRYCAGILGTLINLKTAVRDTGKPVTTDKSGRRINFSL